MCNEEIIQMLNTLELATMRPLFNELEELTALCFATKDMREIEYCCSFRSLSRLLEPTAATMKATDQ